MARQIYTDALAKSMSEPDTHDHGDVLQCMPCGACLPNCPTYRTNGTETKSPGGLVATIKEVNDGRSVPNVGFAQHMYHCLDCRNYQTVCPAEAEVGELMLDARYSIEQHTPYVFLKLLMLGTAMSDQRKLSLYLSHFSQDVRLSLEGKEA